MGRGKSLFQFDIILGLLVSVSLLSGCYFHSKNHIQNDIPVDDFREAFSIESDVQLLNKVQEQTISYFWDGAEPISGMAPERLHMDNIYPTTPKHVITTGGSGFGLMAILVGIERGFIKREQALIRFEKIVNFLKKADRFHGVWPHWIDGQTGNVVPFSEKDNGGDVVETAFLVQGLLSVYEYFKDGTEREQALGDKIDKLWKEIEWNWYTKGEDVLYWHWSPIYNWDMNFPIGGYNECLILYVLAASSPTFPIKPSVYHHGWARNGNIISNEKYYGENLVLDYYEFSEAPVGPMFWGHYSFLGLNPSRLSDKYANYWELVQNQAIIHYKYALHNPNNYKGYGENIWGLTSSYSIDGYKGHRPENDCGVIAPTAAIASIPYTPKQSIEMLKNLYENHDSLIGKYGPYDAFSFEHNWCIPRYLAIDQGPIPVMIENYRSGLLWNLFMANKDVKRGLSKLEFNY